MPHKYNQMVSLQSSVMKQFPETCPVGSPGHTQPHTMKNIKGAICHKLNIMPRGSCCLILETHSLLALLLAWEGENGSVLTGVLLGVMLLPESRKERWVLAQPSVTGERVIFLFFWRLSNEGGVPKLTSGHGEIGMSSPLLPLLRSEIVWPSKRYSVTFGKGQ